MFRNRSNSFRFPRHDHDDPGGPTARSSASRQNTSAHSPNIRPLVILITRHTPISSQTIEDRPDMNTDNSARFKPYTRHTIQEAPQWEKLTEEQRETVSVVSRVLPFRVNAYVMNELIDWDKIPDDSIYRLTFPHRDMLRPHEYEGLRDLVLFDKDEQKIT